MKLKKCILYHKKDAVCAIYMKKKLKMKIMANKN